MRSVREQARWVYNGRPFSNQKEDSGLCEVSPWRFWCWVEQATSAVMQRARCGVPAMRSCFMTIHPRVNSDHRAYAARAGQFLWHQNFLLKTRWRLTAALTDCARQVCDISALREPMRALRLARNTSRRLT